MVGLTPAMPHLLAIVRVSMHIVFMLAMKELTLEQEQEEFDNHIDDLLRDHHNEFVLYKGGKPIAFFQTFEAAYDAGLDQFGIDAVFLVAQIIKTAPQPISVSWDAGVMFG